MIIIEDWPFKPTPLPPNGFPTPLYLPIGCICPPGANKDCERRDCPRQSPTKTGDAA
jgi:hypothetical protein